MKVKNIQIEVEDNETALGIIILTLQDKIKTLEEKTERLEQTIEEIIQEKEWITYQLEKEPTYINPNLFTSND